MTRSTRFTRFCAFGIQLENHEKRFWQASSGRSTRPRKRSYQTAAAMPGEVAKRGCTLARCSNSGSRDCTDSKDKACDARHGARVVHRSEFKNSAKFRRTCSHFAVLVSKFHCCSQFVSKTQIFMTEIFRNYFQLLFLERRSTSRFFSDFLRFRIEN